jgi:hypothetical protein
VTSALLKELFPKKIQREKPTQLSALSLILNTVAKYRKNVTLLKTCTANTLTS